MERSNLIWRKSRASTHGSHCVEVAVPAAHGTGARMIMVRDSKDPGGPLLRLSEAGWRCLVADAKHGRLDIA
jgi:uncharacterized protein DUF397